MPNRATSQGGEPASGANDRVIVVQGGTSAPAAPVSVSSQERDEFVNRLIGHHGSATAALTKLAGEQLKFRRRAQRAEKDLVEAQKQLPAAGAVVLTGDEAKAYKSIKESGLTLDKVPAKLTSLKELESKVSTRDREKDLSAAAGTKYDQKVLTKLLGDTTLEFRKVNVMKEDKSGIETVEVPYVLLKDGDKTTAEALDTYLDREHKEFAEVLKAKGESEQETGSRAGGNGGSGSNGSATMPKQTSTGKGTPPKGKDAEVQQAVSKTTSVFMTPGMRRKDAAGQ